MAGNTSKLSNSTFHNWIKTGLALLYTKEGIQDDVVQEITNFHYQSYNDIINNKGLPAGTTCTSCTTKNIMICNPSNRLCRKLGSKCQTKHKPCPHGICDDFRDIIKAAHRFSEPSFKNSDAQKWCVDFFEVMKCFMPPEGYANKSTAEEVDFNGIISVVITFKHFQNKIAEKLYLPINAFSKARDIGRIFRHTTDFEVTDGEFNDYIDTLSDVLKDPKYFATLREAQEAVGKLEQLRSDSWTITNKDISKILQDAIDAIKENADRFQECLREKTDSSLTSIETAESSLTEKANNLDKRINDSFNKIFQDIPKCKAKIDGSSAGQNENDHETTFDANVHIRNNSDSEQTHQEDLNGTERTPLLTHIYKEQDGEHKEQNLERRPLQQEYSDEITIIDNETVQFQRRVNANNTCDRSNQYIFLPGQNDGYQRGRRQNEHKKGFQRRLIDTYEEKFSKLQVSPLLEEEDAPLLDLYVSPILRILEHHKVQSKEIEVYSYHDVFFKSNRECKNIYITGDAGIGKTAFCQRMALAWCFVHSQSKSRIPICLCFCKENIQESDAVFSNRDLEALKSFDFLFYISLRDTVLCHVEDIITQQVSCVGNKTFLQNLLDTNKCLIILDGLDEWTHPLLQTSCPPGRKVPHRQTYRNCTFLTTSRTSKLDIIRLGTSEIDQQVSVNGIGPREYEQLVTAVVAHLNCIYNTNRHPGDFIKLLEKNNLLDLSQIPIVVTQLICQWCEKVQLNVCKSIVYGSTIKMLFLRSKKLDSQQKEMLSVKTTKFPENWKKIPQLEHLAEFAYSTLFTDDTNTSGLVFDYEQSKQILHGLTSEDMTDLFNVGIISRNKVTATLSERKVKLQFLHRSFREFMAAVYIAMNYRESDDLPHMVTNTFSKVENFLELSNVLIFLASLFPEVLQPLNQLLLKTLRKDEEFVEFRQLHFPGFMSYKTNLRYNRYRECNSNLKALQTLWTTCLRESERSGYNTTAYQLTDICIDDEIQVDRHEIERFLQSSQSTLLSVSTCCYVTELSSVDSLMKFHMEGQCCEQADSLLQKYSRLQCLVLSTCTLQTRFSLQHLKELQSLHLFDVMLEDDDLRSMKKYLAEQNVMTQISLVHVKCAEHGFKGCDDNELNISTHTKLVTLELRRVPIVVSDVHTSQLESCSIETDVDIPPNLVNRLEGALKLQYLTIDLSNCETDANRSQSSCEVIIDTLPKLVFLKCLKLVSVDTGDRVLSLCPRMKDLEQIKLWWVTLTLQSLQCFIDTLPQTLSVINVELLACKLTDNEGSRQRKQLKKIEEKVRSDKRFMVTKFNEQKGQLLTLEFRFCET